MPAVKVACCQIAPQVGAGESNRLAIQKAIRAAVASGARIVVLPELSTSGYVLRSKAEARGLAVRPADGGLDYWSEAAGGDAVVVGGFAELGEGDLLYNSAAVVDGTGVLAIYRKAHLWCDEPRIFAAGQGRPPVVPTGVGSIGVAICYDLFFPEMTRSLARAGAEIIVVPTNSPAVGDGSNADIGIAVTRAAAHVSRVYMAVCDRWGTERGTDWVGRSVIVDPDGRVIGGPPGDRPSMVIADCELSVARRKVVPGTTNDVFDDRRPELYGFDH
ncbi:MAG: carbon-nitrogen hydrolase [Actinobacteria bacterium]|nr:carbon-nitrogen hydrolase [Actinomycetota bacterium]